MSLDLYTLVTRESNAKNILVATTTQTLETNSHSSLLDTSYLPTTAFGPIKGKTRYHGFLGRLTRL